MDFEGALDDVVGVYTVVFVFSEFAAAVGVVSTVNV